MRTEATGVRANRIIRRFILPISGRTGKKREENQQSHRRQRLYAGTSRDQGTALGQNVGEERSRRGGPFYDPANNVYVTKKKNVEIKYLIALAP